MKGLINISENYYENLLLNSKELTYTLTIPKEYVDKGLNVSFTLNGEEIYKQLIKRKEEV